MAGIINFNNYASEYYIKGDKWTRVPFSKFQWTISFIRNDGSDVPTNISYIAKSVELPGWEIQQQTLNQYNKKRVVNTGINLKAINIVFYDTVDGKFREFIQQYMNSFSYNFTFNGQAAIENRDQLREADGFDSNFGMKAIDSIDDNFFKKIYINQEFGREIWQTELQNPKITSVSHDQLDYSQSGFTTWSITIQPESIVHNLTPNVLDADPASNVSSTGTQLAPATPRSIGSGSFDFGSDTIDTTKSDGSVNELADYPAEPNEWPATITNSDAAINGLDLGETTGAIDNSMTNIVTNTTSPTAALSGIQSNPGGSIPSGTAINGSSVANSAKNITPASTLANTKLPQAVSSAMQAVQKVTGMAHALTQIPGLQKYTKGPIADIAKAGQKLRAVNNLTKKIPGQVSALQKYIKGFDPASKGGKWL